MSEYHFIEPLDLLFLRGNQLFGAAGSYGTSQMPPWPSVAAGALRSAILLRDKVNLNDFSQGKYVHPELGTPANPGAFRVTDFRLARRTDKGIEALYPMPADLVVSEKEDGSKRVSQLTPSEPPQGVNSSFSLAKLPLLVEPERSKATSGLWLTSAGWKRYLQGEVPRASDLINIESLWKMQDRTGIGMDGKSGAVIEGRLFTVQGVACEKDVGFLLATTGVTVNDSHHLRFGGDGRSAELTTVDFTPVPPDYARMIQTQRCRIILTSPGLFAHGWRLPGMAEDGTFELQGVKGKVCSAALARAETVSGWDLAKRCPKTALRSAGIGSVYWLDNLEATPEALAELLEQGLWDENKDLSRQAEGFNRFQFAIY